MLALWYCVFSNLQKASWLLGIQNEICFGSLNLNYMASTSPLLNLHFDVIFKEKFLSLDGEKLSVNIELNYFYFITEIFY